MDDCNDYTEQVEAEGERCSDSSMDDCNSSTALFSSLPHTVQIPLWTIVTFVTPFLPSRFLVQIPLWTIVTDFDCGFNFFWHCSDSSMDDCNPGSLLLFPRPARVQIPLWTIVTLSSRITIAAAWLFRFLYGRL